MDYCNLFDVKLQQCYFCIGTSQASLPFSLSFSLPLSLPPISPPSRRTETQLLVVFVDLHSVPLPDHRHPDRLTHSHTYSSLLHTHRHTHTHTQLHRYPNFSAVLQYETPQHSSHLVCPHNSSSPSLCLLRQAVENCTGKGKASLLDMRELLV